MDFGHQPVMLEEVLSYLEPAEGKVIVDGTLGGAGHSSEILKKLGNEGLLIGIDQDQDALKFAGSRLEKISPNYRLFQANYKDFDLCLEQLGIKEIDGMLLDLGVSSFQLDREERGFSYQKDAPLDMRMNQSTGITAAELVNTWPEQELADLIWSYGEERWAKRIAQFICEARRHQPLETTGQLVDVIKAAIPKGARQVGPHPAKRTFQAIRIAVNDELGVLQETLDKVVDYLKPKGRLVVISFHSLEDRIVKKSLQQQTKACICPPDLPVCQCKQVPRLRVLTRKPVLPTQEEVVANPRARSAKLRAAEKI